MAFSVDVGDPYTWGDNSQVAKLPMEGGDEKAFYALQCVMHHGIPTVMVGTSDLQMGLWTMLQHVSLPTMGIQRQPDHPLITMNMDGELVVSNDMGQHGDVLVVLSNIDGGPRENPDLRYLRQVTQTNLRHVFGVVRQLDQMVQSGELDSHVHVLLVGNLVEGLTQATKDRPEDHQVLTHMMMDRDRPHLLQMPHELLATDLMGSDQPVHNLLPVALSASMLGTPQTLSQISKQDPQNHMALVIHAHGMDRNLVLEIPPHAHLCGYKKHLGVFGFDAHDVVTIRKMMRGDFLSITDDNVRLVAVVVNELAVAMRCARGMVVDHILSGKLQLVDNFLTFQSTQTY